MDVGLELVGLDDLRARLGRFDKPLKRRLDKVRKEGSKKLAKKQKAALSGQQKLVARDIKAFSRGDVTGTRFNPTSGAAGPGMGIFAGAKKWPQFRPFVGVDPDSGGHVFYPEGREFGPELARDTEAEILAFIDAEVLR